MPTEWNMFVKKIYEEGKAKDHTYQFKNALRDASKRKSEMKHSSNASGVKKNNKRHKSAKRGKSRSKNVSIAGGRTRKHRRNKR